MQGTSSGGIASAGSASRSNQPIAAPPAALRLAMPRAARIEQQHQRSAPLDAVRSRRPPGAGRQRSDAQRELFLDLAQSRLLRALSRLELASRILPQAAMLAAGMPSLQQDAPGAIDQRDGRHQNGSGQGSAP